MSSRKDNGDDYGDDSSACIIDLSSRIDDDDVDSFPHLDEVFNNSLPLLTISK